MKQQLTLLALVIMLSVFENLALAADSISVGDDLALSFSCVQYKGIGYQFVLRYADELTWKMDANTFTSAGTLNNCLYVPNDLALNISATYRSVPYGFVMKYSDGLNWKADSDTFTSFSTSDKYVVFAWNDLGMHCLNPSYDTAVLLPPYNNLWVQTIRKGSQPEIITNGLSVGYSISNNTYSYGKKSYGQFWDNAPALFGVSLDRNKGLNLNDPDIHFGLSGTMLPKTDHFQADGIPVTPVDDSGTWNPYQIAEITVKNPYNSVVAQTKTTIPTSDEINCAKCHGSTDTFSDIIEAHDEAEHTALASQKPVLCAKCHGSPALGTSGAGTSGKYLSQAIHGFHSSKGAACYDCHPGKITQCNRSKAHTATDGNCTTCHGTMSEIANSIAQKTRIPWVNEPKCVTCHSGIAQVDTGDTLYRKAKGHGNLYCITCHGSPHAMTPSTQSSDNYQAIQYQNKAKTIGSCGACHSGSKGGTPISNFSKEHGGTSPRVATACHVCHTSVSTDTTKWPHAYQWKNR